MAFFVVAQLLHFLVSTLPFDASHSPTCASRRTAQRSGKQSPAFRNHSSCIIIDCQAELVEALPLFAQTHHFAQHTPPAQMIQLKAGHIFPVRMQYQKASTTVLFMYRYCTATVPILYCGPTPNLPGTYHDCTPNLRGAYAEPTQIHT